MHVKVEALLLKDMDLRGFLFFLNLPINSAERCILSEALPPLPHQKNIVFFN